MKWELKVGPMHSVYFDAVSGSTGLLRRNYRKPREVFPIQIPYFVGFLVRNVVTVGKFDVLNYVYVLVKLNFTLWSSDQAITL